MCTEDIQVNLLDLRDSKPGIGLRIAGEIARCGEPGVRQIIEFLVTERGNHIVRNHAFEALGELGPVAARPIRTFLAQFSAFDDYSQVYIIKSLLRTLGALPGMEVEDALIEFLEQISQKLEAEQDNQTRHYMLQVRTEIHGVLASRDCRGALDDLLALLGSGNQWVFPSILQSVGKVGDSRALLPLIRLHAVQRANEWYCSEIRKAFRAILRRESQEGDWRVRLEGLTREEQASMRGLLGARS